MKEYVKKPAIIEAIQFTGKNINEIFDTLGTLGMNNTERGLMVLGKLGCQVAKQGDYIIKNSSGIRVCPQELFEELYEVKG